MSFRYTESPIWPVQARLRDLAYQVNYIKLIEIQN